MPHISHLTIRNFRKFDHLEIDLTDPAGEPVKYFVLAGPNGCGKTTVLEAIAFSTGLYGQPDSDSLSPAPNEVPKFSLPEQTEVKAQFLEHGRARVVTLSNAGLCIEQFSDAGDRSSRDWNHWDLLGVPGRMSKYTSALRTTKSTSGARSADNRVKSFKTALKNQLTRRVPGYRGPEPKDVEWTERLNTFWRKFRNDGTELVMTLVNPDDLDQNDWDLFLYKGDERVCSVGELSSGEQEVIAMAVPFITEPFDGILLIDEPELHLHPEWQARLMRALRALIPEAQIIVATHSDELWDDARSWERLLLVPPDDPRASSNARVQDSAE